MKEEQRLVATPTMMTMQRFLTPNNPYSNPGEVANMLGFVVDEIEKRLTESPTLGGRVYARKNELVARYGVSPNTMTDWLNTLESAGVIHPIQGAPSNGAEGDTLYKIREVDAALRERRKASVQHKHGKGVKAGIIVLSKQTKRMMQRWNCLMGI